MIAELWYQYGPEVVNIQREVIARPALWIVIFLGSILCAWRLWRFTVSPYFYPDSPKELPYWIPYIGHGISFYGNSHALIEKGLEYTNRTHEPFALQIGPETAYIITSPLDVTEVYKKPAALGWEDHLNELFLNFGFNAQTMQLAWQKTLTGHSGCNEEKAASAQQISFIHFVETTYARQLLPGEHMDRLSASFIASLDVSLESHNLDRCTIGASGGPDSEQRTISLMKLCQYTMLEAGINSFFGAKVLQMDSEFIPNMLDFNQNAWMLFYGLPPMFASAVMTPRKAIIDTLTKYISLPEGIRNDQSWGVQRILAAQKEVGIERKSGACLLLMILWAANSNVHNVTFWTLAHIFTSPALRASVRHEVDGACGDNSEPDIKALCANATVLNNIFHEVLRLRAGAMMGRRVHERVSIGGRILEPGARVLIPSRQLHSNAAMWGEDWGDFDAERFAGEGRALLKHSSYRPFGGGVSLCPGRKISKVQVFALVALLVRRFELEECKEMGGAFPTMDVSTPALGVTGPAKGMDVYLNLRERVH